MSDLISRQMVLDLCHNHIDGKVDANDIARMPSAEKTGHWIEKDGYDGDTYYDCSVCGESWSTIEGTPWNNGMNYCPNCGADMRGTEND